MAWGQAAEDSVDDAGDGSAGPFLPRAPGGCSTLTTAQRFGGVVGYRICLTHRRSPVRAWVESFLLAGPLNPRPVDHDSRKL